MFSYIFSYLLSKLTRSKAVGHRACELHDTHSRSVSPLAPMNSGTSYLAARCGFATVEDLQRNRVSALREWVLNGGRAAESSKAVRPVSRRYKYFKPLVPLGLLVLVSAVFATPAMAELGVEKFALSARNANGTPDLRAGSHPYALTTSSLKEAESARGNPKDARLGLLPGFYW